MQEADYIRGIAEIIVDNKIAQTLQKENALQTISGAPSTKEYCSFLERYKDRSPYLLLNVIDPNRPDFRVEIAGITINSEHAKLNTAQDMEFWKAFLKLGINAEMHETEEDITWKNWR